MLMFCRTLPFVAIVTAAAAALAAQPPTPAPAPAPVQPAPAPDKPKTPPSPPTAENPMVNPATGIKLPSGLYDEKADPSAMISKANEKARKEGKRTLLMWGENLCEFCVHLNNLLHDDPQIKDLVEGDYEIVKIFIGKFDRNLDLAAQYKTDLFKTGAPTLTVVNPASNETISVMDGKDALAKPMSIQPLRVFDRDFVFNYLNANRPGPRNAAIVLNDALAAAGKSGKKTIVHFEMASCEACSELQAWLADPKIASILDKGFEVVRIDPERMTLGRNVMGRFAGGTNALPPWIVVLKGDGTPVEPAGAEGKAGLPGLPRNDSEVEPFLRLIVKATDKLSEDDVATLRGSLSPEARKAAKQDAAKNEQDKK